MTLCFHCSRAIVANTLTPLSLFQSEYRWAAGDPPSRTTPAEAASLSGLSPELGCLACVLPKMYRGAKLRRGIGPRAEGGRTTALVVSIEVCFCPREAYTVRPEKEKRQNNHLLH